LEIYPQIDYSSGYPELPGRRGDGRSLPTGNAGSARRPSSRSSRTPVWSSFLDAFPKPFFPSSLRWSLLSERDRSDQEMIMADGTFPGPGFFGFATSGKACVLIVGYGVMQELFMETLDNRYSSPGPELLLCRLSRNENLGMYSFRSDVLSSSACLKSVPFPLRPVPILGASL